MFEEDKKEKKLLMLGGANSQVPAIKRAKELGYYVITCDYLPDNPGHQFSDEYYNISTTDKDAVLELALKLTIDGIIAYASDPAAETAAYVVDKMGLAGAGYDATEILAEKDKFRFFQKRQGFNTPQFVSVSSMEELQRKMEMIPIPCIVKPVDASGSKGVTRIFKKKEVAEAYTYAKKFSRSGRVILEEIIESPYCQMHGDGFIYDGELIFMELGDQRFRNNVPIGSSCPSMIDTQLKEKVWKEVERLLQKVNYTIGGINVEVRITEENEVYIIEVGPRAGGNYVPQLMEAATGFDEMTAVLQTAMGCYEIEKNKQYLSQYCFQYIIGAKKNGIYKNLFINEQLNDQIKYLFIHKKENDQINDYRNSSDVIGVAIICFETAEEMKYIIENIDDYIRVIMRGNN